MPFVDVLCAGTSFKFWKILQKLGWDDGDDKQQWNMWNHQRYSKRLLKLTTVRDIVIHNDTEFKEFVKHITISVIKYFYIDYVLAQVIVTLISHDDKFYQKWHW